MIQTLSIQWSILIYMGLFIGVLLVLDGMFQLISKRETGSEARNRRMRMIQGGANTETVLNLLRDPSLQQGNSSGSLILRLRRLLAHAGGQIGLVGFFSIVVLLAAAVFAAAVQFVDPMVAAPAALFAAFGVPLAVLQQMKEARAKKMTEQLPDALDLMARGLKVGHPLAVTVASVATDMADPIGSEFGVIQDQISYGDDLVTAFHDFAERAGTEDARYLAVSVGIQHGTGGNLARVLNVLGKVIRDRQTMQKKIRAISAEGRLSGVILTFLPVLIFLSIHLSTPSFYGDVYAHPLFRYFGFAIIMLIVAQGLILRRLINFKF
ncbi:type II secretion system F family protein [Puniceibacterium confluentis]|uniref:type II secretion system F family protein n=1 Tax=Puniceibacterium confluentis TaxID=1958944 RepID=UPI0011B80E1E|nr:type II secretion system F family protein [Puniceibacterium confluentis]